MKALTYAEAQEIFNQNGRNAEFVVRDTSHPTEDLERNWSAPLGGWAFSEAAGGTYTTEEEAREADIYYQGYANAAGYGFHPAYGSFVQVHYHGLGAFLLDSETIEEAVKEAAGMDDMLACTDAAGNGAFYAPQCKGFIKVSEDRYIFLVVIAPGEPRPWV